MRQQDFQKILKRYRQGVCSPEEEALVEKWFASMASDEPSIPASRKARIKQRLWAQVHDHIHQSKEKGREPIGKSRTLRISLGPVRAIAATLLLAAVSAVFVVVSPRPAPLPATALHGAEKKSSNHTATVMEVRLSDGSHVFLQPQSSLFYKEPFDGAQRLVRLEGEAFFKVSHDASRPFLVNTNEVITKVLGTSFTVSAFPDDENITVAVMAGKVSVMTRKAKNANNDRVDETILTPNQKVVYNKNKNLVSRTLVNEPVPILPAEAVKRMQFEAAPIAKIFKGLEEVYGVDIEFDEDVFSSCILTTSIGEGSIYNRLDMICKAIDATYALKENMIVVTGSGCR